MIFYIVVVMKSNMKSNKFYGNRFYEEEDDDTLADGKTRLWGFCKFCGLPIEEKQGYCNDTCEELFNIDIGKMTKKDWQNLAKRNKAILTGY